MAGESASLFPHPLFLAEGIHDRWWILVVSLVLVGGISTIHRYRRFRHWMNVTGPGGFGLPMPAVKEWWNLAADSARAHPEVILQTPEAFSLHLEELRRAGHECLVRHLHQTFESRFCRVSPKRDANFAVGDHVMLRNSHGTLLIEGMVRHVTEDEIAVLAYDEGAGWSEDAEDQRLYMESPSGRRMRVHFESSHGGILFRFVVLSRDEPAQRRRADRMIACLEARILPPLPAVAEVRGGVLHPTLASHPLQATPVSEENLLEFEPALRSRGLMNQGVQCLLDDISVGGALIHVSGLPVESLPAVTEGIFLHLSFGDEASRRDLILPAAAVTPWQDAGIHDRGEGFILHLRFLSLENYEIEQVWTLVRRLDRRRNTRGREIVTAEEDRLVGII